MGKAKKQQTKRRGAARSQSGCADQSSVSSWPALVLPQRIREVGRLLALGLAVFLTLALASYHRSDPGWSHAIVVDAVQNLAGVLGAWVADGLLMFFGFAAYAVPLLIAVWVIAWLRTEPRVMRSPSDGLLGYRCMGLLSVLVGSCGFLSLLVKGETGLLPASAGGILGAVVMHGLVPLLNPVGCFLLLSVLWVSGVTLLTGLSWSSFIQVVGRLTLLMCRKTWAQLGRLRQFRVKRCLTQPGSPVQATVSVPSPKRRLFEKSNSVSVQTGSAAEGVALQSEAALKPQTSSSTTQRVTTHHVKSSTGASGMPEVTLLNPATASAQGAGFSEAQLAHYAKEVELRLADFSVSAKVVAVHPGPVVTRFELQLAAGTKASKITGLAKDLARSLSVESVRVVEVIPGKTVVGLELPNKHRETVYLQEVLTSKAYHQAKSAVTLALGKDIAGHPVVVDLAKMPHLLAAGTTGSGKSVSLNVMLLSLLYKSTPEELRLIMIDPKMLELSVYDGIPHLLTPVVTDMKEATNALRWCVAEMERRYRLMAALGVRNIAGYNEKIKAARAQGAPLLDPLWQASPDETADELQCLPTIVVLADEFADMIMVIGKKVEELITRIAQKARAAGIHLILATQRPSVDVITGLIKANIPTRIAFQVSSRIDSRTILDQQGAEQLLGHGDMLYLPPGTAVPVRVHGAYVSDEEVHRVVAHWRTQGTAVEQVDILDEVTDAASDAGGGIADSEGDVLYDQAVKIVTETRKASISSVQRRLKIGYNRAARMIEAMEAAGVVSSVDDRGVREVLAPPPR